MATLPAITTAQTAAMTPQSVGSTSTSTAYAPTTYTAGTSLINSTNLATAASAGAATNWNVDSNQLVDSQVGRIIDQNSPLMQQAETRAKQGMAGRGLLNSSMAVGAGQSALYDAAMPMAQQNAQTYAQAANQNANAANTRAQFDAGNVQQANLANANAQNQTAQYNAQATNSQNQFNAGAQNQAGLSYAQAQNQASQYNAGAQNQTNQFNTQQSNAAGQFNTQQSNAQNQYNAGQANDMIKTGVESDNKLQLAGIEQNYKTLMQANQSAADMYQQTIKNIEAIQTNKDVTAESKTAYIANQTTYLKTYMGMLEKMNNMTGLKDLLTF